MIYLPSFSETAADDLVTINDKKCLLESCTTHQIVCRVPMGPGGNSASGFPVVVNMNGQAATGPQFLYDPSITPTVSQISTTTSGPLGMKRLRVPRSNLSQELQNFFVFI